MPFRYLLALLAAVLVAAGATVWLLTQSGSGAPGAALLPVCLIAALAFRHFVR